MRNSCGYRFHFFGAAGGPVFMQRLDAMLAALGPRAANVSLTAATGIGFVNPLYVNATNTLTTSTSFSCLSRSVTST